MCYLDEAIHAAIFAIVSSMAFRSCDCRIFDRNASSALTTTKMRKSPLTVTLCRYIFPQASREKGPVVGVSETDSINPMRKKSPPTLLSQLSQTLYVHEQL